MEEKNQSSRPTVEDVKDLLDQILLLDRKWLLIVTIFILVSMIEVTNTNEGEAGNLISSNSINFRLTSITVLLVVLIWLPSFLKLIALLGGALKTNVVEVNAKGLLEQYSMAIDPNLKKLPVAKPDVKTQQNNFVEQTPLDEEEIDLSSRNGRNIERKQIYKRNKDIFVTHILEPSKIEGQKYDIFIYLVRHQRQDFSDVEKAEFFFGKYWGYEIFEAKLINGLIGVSTSAYGPFLCTCLVTFKDSTKVSIYRYIDFEMGKLINKALA